jgi:hypothetical protein
VTLNEARKNFTRAFIKDINREIEVEDEIDEDNLYDPVQALLPNKSQLLQKSLSMRDKDLLIDEEEEDD